MALITCHECKESFSSDAKSCPKCGAIRKRVKYGNLIFGAILVIGLLVAMWQEID